MTHRIIFHLCVSGVWVVKTTWNHYLNDSFLISIHNRSLLFSFMLCFKLLSFYFYLSTFSIEYTSLALMTPPSHHSAGCCPVIGW